MKLGDNQIVSIGQGMEVPLLAISGWVNFGIEDSSCTIGFADRTIGFMLQIKYMITVKILNVTELICRALWRE